MSVRHRNDYGKIEILDRPLSDCACNGCSRARRSEERSSSRRGGQRSFPPNNATVNGQPGYATQSGDRTRAWWGDDKESEVVTNDGLNASYVREDGVDIVDDRLGLDDPYRPREHRRRNR